VKIHISTDEKCSETEITVRCRHLSDDIEKLLSAIRMLDMKLTGNKDGREFIIEAADIVYIDSVDKHSFLYTLTDVFESVFKLYELEAKLVNLDFLRASKNCLFNINQVQSIEPDFDRKLILTMLGGNKIVVSRQYAVAVKEKLEAYHGRT
jgi:DNA-binding LytR/AlgR family response regulator